MERPTQEIQPAIINRSLRTTLGLRVGLSLLSIGTSLAIVAPLVTNPDSAQACSGTDCKPELPPSTDGSCISVLRIAVGSVLATDEGKAMAATPGRRFLVEADTSNGHESTVVEVKAGGTGFGTSERTLIAPSGTAYTEFTVERQTNGSIRISRLLPNSDQIAKNPDGALDQKNFDVASCNKCEPFSEETVQKVAKNSDYNAFVKSAQAGNRPTGIVLPQESGVQLLVDPNLVKAVQWK